MAPLCGIDADTLRDVARTFAGAKAGMIFWGMGISQHIHGTDNSRCLISLALMTGQCRPVRQFGTASAAGAEQCSRVRLTPGWYPDVFAGLSIGYGRQEYVRATSSRTVWNSGD